LMNARATDEQIRRTFADAGRYWSKPHHRRLPLFLSLASCPSPSAPGAPRSR